MLAQTSSNAQQSASFFAVCYFYFISFLLNVCSGSLWDFIQAYGDDDVGVWCGILEQDLEEVCSGVESWCL